MMSRVMSHHQLLQTMVLRKLLLNKEIDVPKELPLSMEMEVAKELPLNMGMEAAKELPLNMEVKVTMEPRRGDKRRDEERRQEDKEVTQLCDSAPTLRMSRATSQIVNMLLLLFTLSPSRVK